MSVLLEVRDLATYFYTLRGTVRAVDGASFTIDKGEVLGIVGESGCGKTVLALSVMRLLPVAKARIVRGDIRFENHALLSLPEEDMRSMRGRKMSMIFQEPMTALNPVFRIGDQIVEAILTHNPVTKTEARERAIDMLSQVGFPDPYHRVDDYPHELSGGMRQRVMIAMALVLEPRLMWADEPTTALDVTIQAQILELLKQLQSRLGTSIIFITHDLGVVYEVAERVAVMYAGEIIEMAPVEALFSNPAHPYTVGLMASIPPAEAPSIRTLRLTTIPGNVPVLLSEIKGCRFQDRCSERREICTEMPPEWKEVIPQHRVKCWKFG